MSLSPKCLQQPLMVEEQASPWFLANEKFSKTLTLE